MKFQFFNLYNFSQVNLNRIFIVLGYVCLCADVCERVCLKEEGRRENTGKDKENRRRFTSISSTVMSLYLYGRGASVGHLQNKLLLNSCEAIKNIK